MLRASIAWVARPLQSDLRTIWRGGHLIVQTQALLHDEPGPVRGLRFLSSTSTPYATDSEAVPIAPVR